MYLAVLPERCVRVSGGRHGTARAVVARARDRSRCRAGAMAGPDRRYRVWDLFRGVHPRRTCRRESVANLAVVPAFVNKFVPTATRRIGTSFVVLADGVSCKYELMDELREVAVRTALFAYLDELTSLSYDGTLRWDQTASFEFTNEVIAIRQTRGRGINKPATLGAALSITTAFTPFHRQPPYDDLQGPDGYPRYKYEGTDPNFFTNRALRACMDLELPLVYFIGVRRGVYKPDYPIFVIGDDPNRLEFTLGYSRAEIGRDVSTLSPVERRYIFHQTRSRLHQPIFREQVLSAYTGACAICHLKHSQLLDAAHIIADSKPRGDPVVVNGIALCKIHHAAFDQNLLGIRPDYQVVINNELLRETDGPMLKHGLQEMHGETLSLPHRSSAHPDASRLEERFAEFCAAS